VQPGRFITPDSGPIGQLVLRRAGQRARQVGNFPQAFSHLTLITAARAISTAGANVEQVTT